MSPTKLSSQKKTQSLPNDLLYFDCFFPSSPQYFSSPAPLIALLRPSSGNTFEDLEDKTSFFTPQESHARALSTECAPDAARDQRF
jgi:hypothetical protein